MYLISVYFDNKSNKIISDYINKIAQKTGNTFMTDNPDEVERDCPS